MSARGVGVDDLAERVRVAPHSLAAIVRGTHAASPEVAYRLAKALELPPALIRDGLPDISEARTMRERRRAAGIKIGELADLTGYSPAHLGSVENGLKPAYPALLSAVASALGCGPDDLQDAA